jgi:hypothetical protein
VRLILILVLFSSSVAHAGWWKDFCEKYIVAPDPIFKTAAEGKELDPQVAEYLIARYRYFGAKAYYGDKGAGRELRLIGEELRAFGLGHQEYLDYGEFER